MWIESIEKHFQWQRFVCVVCVFIVFSFIEEQPPLFWSHRSHHTLRIIITHNAQAIILFGSYLPSTKSFHIIDFYELILSHSEKYSKAKCKCIIHMQHRSEPIQNVKIHIFMSNQRERVSKTSKSSDRNSSALNIFAR